MSARKSVGMLTRYQYEKQIKELRREVSALSEYRALARKIFSVVCDQIQDGKGISSAWIVKQFLEVMR